jgi:hypothetical protein
MRVAAALVLFAHGFAHLVGFVVPWRLAALPEMPYKTTIFGGRVNVGDSAIKSLGVVWLLLAVAFVASAVGLLLHGSWWLPFTIVVAVLSLVMCAVGWPDSKIGAPVNLAVIIVAIFVMR